MSEEKIFFQDFLFKDMPVDEQDNPIVEMQYLPEGADISNYMIERSWHIPKDIVIDEDDIEVV